MENQDDWTFKLSLDDYTMILNALHYYKKVEKRGNFIKFNDVEINTLRDKLSHQLCWGNTDLKEFFPGS